MLAMLLLAMLLRKTPLVGAKLYTAGSPQAKDTRGKGTRRYATRSQGKLCVGLVRLVASLGICAMVNGMVQTPAQDERDCNVEIERPAQPGSALARSKR